MSSAIPPITPAKLLFLQSSVYSIRRKFIFMPQNRPAAIIHRASLSAVTLQSCTRAGSHTPQQGWDVGEQLVPATCPPWPEHHVKLIECRQKGHQSLYFVHLGSLCSDNKEIFSSTQLQQLVKGTWSSLKKLQMVPRMVFSPSLPPAAATIPASQSGSAAVQNLPVARSPWGGFQHSSPHSSRRCQGSNTTQSLGICLSPAFPILFASGLPLPIPQAIFLRQTHKDKPHKGNIKLRLYHLLY